MNVEYELFDGCEVVFETPDDGYSYFFGYYDKSPLNRANDKLLAHRVSFDGREVRDGDVAEVGYFDLQDGGFVKIGETLAWNWQQGSQLQWLPPLFKDKIIYNNIQNGQFVSIIHDIQTGYVRTIPFPVYVIHPNGKEALGVNFERHYWCRPGYRYQNIQNKKWDQPYHKEDGIYRIDLNVGSVDLILPITDVVANKRLPEFENNNNWLEHLLYSPSGERFLFFHRWSNNNIDESRVYTANSNSGGELFMLPDNKFYSHYYWKNNSEITIWTTITSVISESLSGLRRRGGNASKSNLWLILRAIYRASKVFMPQSVRDNIIPNSKLVTFRDMDDSWTIEGDGVLYGNGHQSWFDGSKRLLNDTYQDDLGYRHLIVFNVDSSVKKIGSFASKYNDCGYRCDLHPRLSIDNKLVVVDSAHKLKRKILVIGL